MATTVAPQGFTVGTLIPPLVVAKAPKDLPEKYAKRIKDDTYVLVDGYLRYEAIRKTFGLNTKVSIIEIYADSYQKLLEAAFTANQSNPMALSNNEKRSAVFRMLLLGYLDEGLDQLHNRFSDSFSRSSLAEYKRLAEFAREEAKLNDLPPDEIPRALETAINKTLGGMLHIMYDSKGFPKKSTVSAWRQIIETGDVSKWIVKRYKEEKERAREAKTIEEMIRIQLKGKSPEAVTIALRKHLAVIEKELAEVPDDDSEN